MSDRKSFAQQQEDFYRTQDFEKLKETARVKINENSELTLREDFALHASKYDGISDTHNPRAIQVLYRDLIWQCANRMKDDDTTGLLDIDNVIVYAQGRYAISKIAANKKDSKFQEYPESLFQLSSMLNPDGNPYTMEFQNFLQLLKRVENNRDMLEKLYYHPGLQSEEENGLLMYNSYKQIVQRSKTDRSIWHKLIRKLGMINTQRTEQFYADVCTDYAAKGNKYFNDGKGFIYYYKDVLEHLNEKIQRRNDVKKIEVRAEARAKGIVDKKKVNELVAQNMLPRRTLGELVREMQGLFPGKALEQYIFMIEENINFNLNFLSSQPMATMASYPPAFQQQQIPRQPPLGAQLPQFVQHQPQFVQHQPQFAQHQPQFAQHQPQFAQHQPQYAQHQPQYAQHQPQYAHQPPQYAHQPPQYAHQPPQYAHQPPQYAHQPPQYGAPQHRFGAPRTQPPRST